MISRMCDIALAIGQCFKVRSLTTILKRMSSAIFSYLDCLERITQSFTRNVLEETPKNRRDHAPMIWWDYREPRSHNWIRMVCYQSYLDKVVDTANGYSKLKGYSSEKQHSCAIMDNKQINQSFTTSAKVRFISWVRRNGFSLEMTRNIIKESEIRDFLKISVEYL